MSFQATAWASKVKTGSPAAKAVLMMIANYMAPHEDEADGFLSGFPGQDIIAEESEMSVRACRDHIKSLVSRGLLQRKKRYKWDGTRTSDWYRIPVKPDGTISDFPTVEDPEMLKQAPREWPDFELAAGSADDQNDPENPPEDELPADVAGSRLPADERSDYRQLVAGNKREDQLGSKDSFTHYVRKESSSFPTPSTETTDRAREAPRQEKISSTEAKKIQAEADRQAAISELTQAVRDFVMGLKWYGREWGTPAGVTSPQLHTIAALVEPFFEAGCDRGRLRRALVEGTEKAVHDIVAVYIARLKKLTTAEVMPVARPQSHAQPPMPPKPREAVHDDIPARRKLLSDVPVPPKPPWCGECEKFTRMAGGIHCPICSLTAAIENQKAQQMGVLTLVPDDVEPSPDEMAAMITAALAV